MIDFSFLHLKNAFEPMDVTFFPIVTEVSEDWFFNAFDEIWVTLQVILSILMVSGILTEDFLESGFT